jgi:hypothetical protein
MVEVGPEIDERAIEMMRRKHSQRDARTQWRRGAGNPELMGATLEGSEATIFRYSSL